MITNLTEAAARMRSVARGLSYNDGKREAAAKHLLIETASQIDQYTGSPSSVDSPRTVGAAPEHGAPYGTPGAKVSIDALLRPADPIPEVTSQEDEAFGALPAITADRLANADLADLDHNVPVNEALDQFSQALDAMQAARLKAWAEMDPDDSEGTPPTPCPPLAPQIEEAAGKVFKHVADLPPDYDERTRLAVGPDGSVVIAHPDLPVLIAAPPHDSLEEAQMAAGWPQEAQPATVAATSKPTNPKDPLGDTRVPLALLSPIAKAHWALAQHCGRVKYGAWNWREAGARASVYISAIQRHADGYLSGETNDPVDGTHHLGNIMACCAILLEAEAAGKLQDDRPPVVGMRETYAAVEKQQKVLTEKYAGRTAKHWTIKDAQS